MNQVHHDQRRDRSQRHPRPRHPLFHFALLGLLVLNAITHAAIHVTPNRNAKKFAATTCPGALTFLTIATMLGDQYNRNSPIHISVISPAFGPAGGACPLCIFLFSLEQQLH